MTFALLLLAAWPVTAAEKKGDAYVYDARVVDSAPCTSKQPVELRLFVRGAQLRQTIKNCGDKPVKVLDSAQLQPSRLELTPAAKSVFDERSRAKFDATVYVHSFTTLAPAEERVVEEESVKGGALSWGPFSYEGVAAKAKLKVVWEAKVSDGFDEAAKKKVPVEGAVTGAFVSNEVVLALP